MGKRLFDALFPGTSVTYKDKLIELVKLGNTGKQICREMNIDYSNMHRWLRKLGLHLPNHQNELKFDNAVFDTIDTEEKAYWLGFLFADGYVSSVDNTVELSLMGSDKDHLEKFKDFLKVKREVHVGISKCNGKVFSRCRLSVTDKHFHNILVSKGCVPNKSLILAFPNNSIFTSEDLIIHFIRGYVDGDGCVYKGSSNYSIFSIVGTKEFLEGIKNVFPNLFTSIYYKDKRRLKNTYFLELSAEKSAKFGDALYANATIFLERKYNKFITYKYDERESFRRVHTFSEKQQLYFNRGRNRNRENFNIS